MDIQLQICKLPAFPAFTVPMVGSPVRAGYPSPADDFLEDFIDLNKELVKNKATTFYARVVGNSMETDFSEGDVLVVDRSLPLQNRKIAVCFVDGSFTVKKVRLEKEVLYLEALNTTFEPIRITEDNQFLIWGIVTYVVKRVW